MRGLKLQKGVKWNKILLMPMYFAEEREMLVREGQLIPIDGPIPLLEGEKTEMVMVDQF